MRLKPLSQWICDRCGEVIEGPPHGYLEWRRNRGDVRAFGFKIVHYKPYSPQRSEGGCYFYDGYPGRMGGSLAEFTGDHAMPSLLSFVDQGPIHEKVYRGPMLVDYREWVELVRRLTIPGYEEARLYREQAVQDGFFAEMDERAAYRPDILRQLIGTYGKAS